MSERQRRAGRPLASQLRVYEPLSAFTAEERERIGRGTSAEGRKVLDRAEAEEALRRIIRTSGDPFPDGRAEFTRSLTVDGHTLYCPSQLVLRAGLAAESVLTTAPAPLASVLLPESARAKHQERVDRLAEESGTPRINTRESLWGIPFSWFVLFHEGDPTEVVEEDDHVVTVRITASWAKAISRARFAVANLALAAPEMNLLDELTTLTEWLEEFHPDSMIELDYGSVADRVFPDDSPSDVLLGIECLAEGDMTGAAAAYRRLASRWIPIRQLARAS
ncbi:hypothetical protein SCMU_04240 [Sinomonas cyclohexanicum]|uniref:DUF8083 domain-containing protein n=1 Tax=Sinomonas cyclohexanicum TaxID=322009 RepID=A0ABN6FCF0_SINCY|nr:hypothetical protein [Corynebacterium cyclohexanicum]BCT74582.1 hypothetical protein SCMU_04240 [Corynebacterium cyclohexanicum]